MNSKIEGDSRKDLLKYAYLKIQELQARLEQKKDTIPKESIAMIGMGCRFPAGANDPDSFWKLLKDGVDTVGEIPSDRWDVEAYFDPDPEAAGKMYTRNGAFLNQIDQFDPQFFGISPREAAKMDPQQRVLLEVALEAFEHAGQASENLAGSSTGVFIGMNGDDYSHLISRTSGTDAIDLYFGTGVARSIAAGRISYALGLKGPCISLDTACSGSLVAVHLACQSLKMRECRMAIAGGITLIITPDGHIIGSKGQMLSREGRCKTFDDTADGYVRGEGCGIVVLKRLSDAMADSDNILAVIRGTALNQDGRSGGMTAPNGKAQEEVIRKALDDAGVEPGEAGYIETHGTGTILGDPIEVQALGSIYGEFYSKDAPLYIGSVKTNVGHLEAAAGIVSLIKTTLALQHSEIPPNLHFKKPNAHIPWKELPIVVATERTAWPLYSKRRIAGVSSFGFSGTNAHLIVESAPKEQPDKVEAERAMHLLPLSTKSSKALNEMTERYLRYFDDHELYSIANVCFTAGTGRSHFNHRMAVTGTTMEDIKKGLQAFRKGEETTSVIHGETSSKQPPPVAFLFTGQGSQYVGMGRTLYETQPAFRKILDRCNELLMPSLKVPLLSVLYPEPEGAEKAQELLNQTSFTQPALFAFEFALAELWKSWGVESSVVMGHSVGEYVAACIAGVFSLEDGLKLIAERGRLMQELPEAGSMAAVFAGEKTVTAEIESFAETISIAAINGPQNTVISGMDKDLNLILKNLKSKGINSQKLVVSNAFHSPLMEPMLQEFEKVAGEIEYHRPCIDLVSNVTGRLIEGDEISNSAYWFRHVQKPVRFIQSIQTLYEQNYRFFLEIGPHPVLLGMGAQYITGDKCVWLPSLRRSHDDWEQILKTLGRLYVDGSSIDWESFYKYRPHRRVPLPTYPFQRERYWSELPNKQRRIWYGYESNHPLLGQKIRSPKSDDIIMQTELDLDVVTYIKSHRIFDNVILPATAYLEMAQAVAGEIYKDRPCCIEEFNIHEPLIIEAKERPTVQVIVSKYGENEAGFEVYSLGEEKSGNHSDWKLHASGKLFMDAGDEQKLNGETKAISREQLETECKEVLSGESYYKRLYNIGVDYGPAFQGLNEIRMGDGQVIGKIHIPDEIAGEIAEYYMHPALLDISFQILGMALPFVNGEEIQGNIYLPMGLDSYRIFQRASKAAWCYGTIRPGFTEGGETFIGDIRMFDSDGNLLAEINGLRFKRALRQALQRMKEDNFSKWFYETKWQPLKNGKSGIVNFSHSGRWLIFADRGGIGEGLANLFKERGEETYLVYAGEGFYDQTKESTVLNPTSCEDFKRLVKKASTEAETPIRGIIYLWSSEIKPPDNDFLSLEEFPGPGCLGLLNLIQALANVTWTEPPHLTIVTSGAMSAGTQPDRVNVAQSPIWGLGRVIAAEYPELQSKLIDLDPSSSGEDNLRSLLAEVVTKNRSENQIAIRQGRRLGLRLVRSRAASHQDVRKLQDHGDRPYQLEISHRGVLDNLELKPAVVKQPEAGEVQIRVDVSGLNFRDVLNALDMYPGDPGPLGNECIGRISALGEGVSGFEIADQVLALTPQAFCSYVNVKAELVVHKPDEMSIEEAATIPMTFLTAHYALNHLAGIKTGDKVLIHAAAGGVGMAALQLAQRAGAEIFATAGAPEKQALLHSMGVKYVMSSRTLDFADEVMKATDGRGVDIVLNALADDFIPKSLSVLGKGGRFLELGKTDLWDEEKVAQVNPNISYDIIFLGDVCRKTPELIQSMFQELIHGFREGTIKPLPYKLFSIDHVESAFRFMAQAKHIGKIVVDQRQVNGEVSIRADATYLITGGLGGLGLQFARWMVERGARHLVLLARKPADEKIQKAIDQLETDGAKIIIAQVDVAEKADLQNVLSSIEPGFPLRGIIHAAGVVDDAALINQNRERFIKVFRPKVIGSWLLHSLTEDIDLDFFVMCSAGAALFGSPGQANYAAANAFMDGLAYARRGEGLPATSINWGPWDKVGMAADLGRSNRQRWQNMGMGFIQPWQGCLALERLLGVACPQVAVLPMDWNQMVRNLKGSQSPPLIADIVNEEKAYRDSASSSVQPSDLRSKLEALDAEDRYDMLLKHVRQQVFEALELKPTMEVKLDLGLTDLGMDSLMAVEISNRLKRSLGCNLPSTLAFEYPTIEALADFLLKEITSKQERNKAELPFKELAVQKASDENLWDEGEI